MVGKQLEFYRPDLRCHQNMFHRQQSQRQMSISGCKWPLIILLSFIIRKHILAMQGQHIYRINLGMSEK